MIAKKRYTTGFTLIELMIVVAIIGVLAAIAFPLYQKQVESTRRANAESDLTQLSQVMERQFATSFDYTKATLPFFKSPQNGTTFYNISFVTGTLTAKTYTLQAVPTNGQTDDDCGTLTIDQAGTRTPTTNGCW